MVGGEPTKGLKKNENKLTVTYFVIMKDKDMKDDLISKLKRKITEPKVFSLLISSMRGQIMYMGIHFSLEEAYAEAKRQMNDFSPLKDGESVDLDLWNAIPARQVVSQIVDPSFVDSIFGRGDKTTDPIEMLHPDMEIDRKDINEMTLADIQVAKEAIDFDKIIGEQKESPISIDANLREVRKMKNELMKKLILSGRIELVDKAKSVLGTTSIKYVKNKIEENKIIRDDDF